MFFSPNPATLISRCWRSVVAKLSSTRNIAGARSRRSAMTLVRLKSRKKAASTARVDFWSTRESVMERASSRTSASTSDWAKSVRRARLVVLYPPSTTAVSERVLGFGSGVAGLGDVSHSQGSRFLPSTASEDSSHISPARTCTRCWLGPCEFHEPDGESESWGQSRDRHDHHLTLSSVLARVWCLEVLCPMCYAHICT